MNCLLTAVADEPSRPHDERMRVTDDPETLTPAEAWAFRRLAGFMVPAMALITSSARSVYRGSFMSVNFAVQQIALGRPRRQAG